MDPARCPVDGHEQVPAPGFIGHLREVLVVDMDKTGLVGFKRLRFDCIARLGRAQVRQPGDAIAPQAAIQRRAREVGVDELMHHRQQVIERQQQCAAQLDNESALNIPLCDR